MLVIYNESATARDSGRIDIISRFARASVKAIKLQHSYINDVSVDDDDDFLLSRNLHIIRKI